MILSRCNLLAIFFVFLIGCNGHNTIAQQIDRQLQSGATKIDVGRLGDFSWDHLFVFGPYSPKEQICETVKLSKHECSVGGVRDVDEGESLLVFMNGSTLSKIESFPRLAGNFDDNCLAKDIPRAKAQLTVNRNRNVYLMCQ
jgi:hypothetical protein